MPKSKLRGNAKTHNKRVTTRNNTIRGLKKKLKLSIKKCLKKLWKL